MGEADRNFQMFCNSFRRKRRKPGRKTIHADLSNTQSQEFFKLFARIQAIRLKFKCGFILMRKSKLSAVENNQPARLQPYQEQGKRRKGSVDRSRLGSSDLKIDVGPLHGLIHQCGYKSSQQG